MSPGENSRETLVALRYLKALFFMRGKEMFTRIGVKVPGKHISV